VAKERNEPKHKHGRDDALIGPVAEAAKRGKSANRKSHH
jgi:hypothetical protein